MNGMALDLATDRNEGQRLPEGEYSGSIMASLAGFDGKATYSGRQ